MCGNSKFAIKIGKVIGAGVGRGNALLILIAGVALATIGIVVSRLKSVNMLEGELNKNETITKTCP